MSTQIIPDDEFYIPCTSPEHNPPSMIVIPPGSKLVHTCPRCGEVTTIRPNIVICESPNTFKPYENFC